MWMVEAAAMVVLGRDPKVVVSTSPAHRYDSVFNLLLDSHPACMGMVMRTLRGERHHLARDSPFVYIASLTWFNRANAIIFPT